MAITYTDNGGGAPNGSDLEFTYTFPVLKTEDVKVALNNVVQATTKYTVDNVSNPTKITFNNTSVDSNVQESTGAPKSGVTVRVFRQTTVGKTSGDDDPKAVFAAGSSIRAADLNANQEQALFAIHELQDQPITDADLGDGAVTTAKIADLNVTTAKIADANVTTDKIADNAVTMAKLAGGTLPTDITVASANITDLTVATADLANDAVTGAKIADDSINSEHYVDGSIDTAHIADSQVTTAKLANTNVTDAKLASNSVTSSKITDANVTTVKIADSNVTLAKLASDLKQTTISDSDTQLPTSGAVVDYVAAQLEPFGGFEAIANEVSFPNTQPVSGVAISIADAAGIVVSASGSSTTGRTVGGTTVTINNIPSNFHSSTVASGIRFIVTSTGSGQVYNYHKATLAEDDLVNLSGDINDFNERYRVGSSNPTSNNDAGDLFFNTGTNKLLVYNSSTGAFEETQSVGQFFINTISSSSGTGGGSATFNGSAYRFTLSNAGTVAEQHIVSINGVIQKPNSGTGQPSEGFALDGGDIIFASAPASGVDFFIITIGSTVNINEPSAGSVTAAKIASGAVTTAKIADDAVDATKLANTSVTAGSYGSSTSIPSITVDAQGRITAASGNSVNTDVVGDTSPQLGGALDTNGNNINFGDSTGGGADDRLVFGAGSDLNIYSDGTNAHIEGDILEFKNAAGDEFLAKMSADGAVELYHNNNKKLETVSGGVTVTGTVAATSYTGDGSSLTGVASAVADGCIYENSQTISNNYTITTNKNALSAGPITIANGVTLTIPSGSTYTIV